MYTSLRGNSYFTYVEGIEATTLVGLGGDDSAQIMDSEGDDQLVLGVASHRIQSDVKMTELFSFETVQAFATQGHDEVTFLGTAGDEAFHAKPTHAWLTTEDTLSYARGFDVVRIRGAGGEDIARLYDSIQTDYFVLAPGEAQVQGPGFVYQVTNVARIHAVSRQGADQAELVDSAERDKLYATDKGVWLTGAEFLNSLVGFGQIRTESTGGHDRLLLASALASLITSDEDTWMLDEHDFELVARGFAYYSLD